MIKGLKRLWLGLLLLPSNLPAQTAPPSPPSLAARPKAIAAPFVYPEEAWKAGHQGKVFVHVALTVGGTPGEVTVATSSGSSILDADAVSYVRRWSFEPARNQSGVPIPSSFDIPVEYFKARESGINAYKCADFVIDTQWYAQQTPADPTRNDTFYHMVLGMTSAHVILSMNQGAIRKFYRDFDAAWAKARERCVGRPDDKFLAVFYKLLK